LSPIISRIKKIKNISSLNKATGFNACSLKKNPELKEKII